MSILLVIVLVVLVVGLAYGLYTRKGSGISAHPQPDPHPVIEDGTGVNDDQSQGETRTAATETSELDQRGTR